MKNMLKGAKPEVALSKKRPSWDISSSSLILASAFFSATLYHYPLYRFAFSNLDLASPGGSWTLFTLFILVFSMNVMILGGLSAVSLRLLKPALVVVALINSVAVYFVYTYGVVLDKTMMGNVFNTDIQEAVDLFHPGLIAALALMGLVPVWLLSKVNVRKTSILRRALLPILAGGITLCWLIGASWTWLWIDKNAKQIGGMVLPWSPIINGARYLSDRVTPPVRKDLPAALATGQDKKVVLLVIGESARAQNFSLYGYERQTNPKMSSAGVSVLKNAYSCATYTTAALECILAHDEAAVDGRWETLTSYLQRSGVEVTWRSHNAGEPPMKVQHYQKLEDFNQKCQGEECSYDGGLLFGLEQQIAAATDKRVLVVLHLTGSHGPAYNTRYPKSFEKYKPVCESVQLQQCSREQLINAYDNSIRYTDHVVGQAIDLLKRVNADSTLFYLADHGESLGESNLYLHGAPWVLAPDEQKRIPFVVWDSKVATRGAAAARVFDGDFGQANVFHSVLGALGISSPAYKAELDVLAKVRLP